MGSIPLMPYYTYKFAYENQRKGFAMKPKKTICPLNHLFVVVSCETTFQRDDTLLVVVSRETTFLRDDTFTEPILTYQESLLETGTNPLLQAYKQGIYKPWGPQIV